MFSCAAERDIDFCIECMDYPCSDLKQFQGEMPHRNDFEDIKNLVIKTGVRVLGAIETYLINS